MNPRPILTLLLLSAALVSATAALAQDKGTRQSEAAAAARQSRRSEDAGQGIVRPARHRRAAGGARRSASTPRAASPAPVALPINGKTWQVMRLSRNRNWGHPELVAFLERLAQKAPQAPAGAGSWSATCRSRAAARC